MIQRIQSSNVFPSANSNGLLELNSRIEKLNMYKSHIEGDVADLQDSMKLNIKAASILLRDLTKLPHLDSRKLERITNLIQQNGFLVEHIREMRQQKQAVVAEALIHNQVMVEEEIFFVERVTSNHERIDDLRKLMHDKQYSYSGLVENLNEYEELPEREFSATIPNIEYVLHDNNNKKVMAKLSHEKYEFTTEKTEMINAKVEIRSSFRKVIDSMANGMDYQKIVSMVSQNDELRSEGHGKLCKQESLNNAQELNPMKFQSAYSPLRSVHRELLILMKREKKARFILQEQIKQSVEIGRELKNYSQKLQEGNRRLQRQLDKCRKNLKNLNINLLHYSNCINKTTQWEIKVQDLIKEQESNIIDGLQYRTDIHKRAFHDVFLIKCGSEPDCSRDYWESDNHRSTADLD